MSRKITIQEISNAISDEHAAAMMKMETEQTPEWRTLIGQMSYEQKNEYYEIKERLLKRNRDLKSANKEDLRKEYLAFYHQGVTRGSFSFTIEHFIEEADSDTHLESIKQNYGHEAFKMVKALREIRTKDERFTFFWETESVFSQWHKSVFNGASTLFINDDQKKKLLGQSHDIVEFMSAEQFMMYHKAILFLDTGIAQEILKTSNPRKMKDLGRLVKDFDEDVWAFFRGRIVYEGNKAKFSQDEKLRKALFDTKGTTLVEASPNDFIWGIGLSANDADAQLRTGWKGKNLLGEILTLLRIEMMGSY